MPRNRKARCGGGAIRCILHRVKELFLSPNGSIHYFRWHARSSSNEALLLEQQLLSRLADTRKQHDKSHVCITAGDNRCDNCAFAMPHQSSPIPVDVFAGPQVREPRFGIRREVGRRGVADLAARSANLPIINP